MNDPKTENRKEHKHLALPAKMLISFVVSVESDDDELVNKEAHEVAKKFMASDKVKNILYRASKEISEELDKLFLIVPGVLLPTTDEKETTTALNFITTYLDSLNESGEEDESETVH